MIELIFGGMVYAATLVRCYDGDTCTVILHETPALVSQQNIRLSGFDTPEIRGKCDSERATAHLAKQVSISYISRNNEPWIVIDNNDKYGRIVAEVPGLAHHLVGAGVARYYDGGKRKGWCDD